ncbi:MAG TPA: hypothetical protein VNF73_05070 [Candidatus Saccharimonadales bacterium]|nr:hypothetical protein [Candidatus Saccharimonadales bacterium]
MKRPAGRTHCAGKSPVRDQYVARHDDRRLAPSSGLDRGRPPGSGRGRKRPAGRTHCAGNQDAWIVDFDPTG